MNFQEVNACQNTRLEKNGWRIWTWNLEFEWCLGGATNLLSKFWERVELLELEDGWREEEEENGGISLLQVLLNEGSKMKGWDCMRLSKWRSKGGEETTWWDPKGSLGQITKESQEWVVKIEEFGNDEGSSGHPTISGWTQIPSSGMCREVVDARMRG